MTKKVEKYSIQDLDSLIKSIKTRFRLTEDQVTDRVGYNKGYISQSRTRGTVSEKFIKALEREFGGEVVQNIDINDKSKAYDALFSVLIAEVSALKAKESGEHPEVIARRMRKAAEDVLKLA